LRLTPAYPNEAIGKLESCQALPNGDCRSLRQSIGSTEAFGRQAIKIYRYLVRGVPMLASASP
jgi:hypothetical protein